ncbi:hypothetical protein DFO73_11328 [Cytobacillus oceanisediminis]|jgi:hypothetical protein|uniref:Quinol monooxygenase YgiN n=1 Tax=Cytobacillus oceanisediminis TaxID=665099 RepID=A0A2V2ZM97_9BACI|nr:hypothetical protein [Cytobacillus oceanisediminis]PWW25430.1 hypothetical protein DFO73_11328 [Cytobacillus oceanisediminis]
MKQNVQMIVQYEVKNTSFSQYQEVISKVIDMLPSYDAAEINISHYAADSYKIIESFIVPTESHYFALKKLRKSKKHNVFGSLDPFISGGLAKMDCWALKKELY